VFIRTSLSKCAAVARYNSFQNAAEPA